MMKQVEIRKKSRGPKQPGIPYVRFTQKMLYISDTAMRMIPGAAYITMGVDAAGHYMAIRPAQKETPNAFKLSKVCETACARRIETSNSLLSVLDAGFPRWAIGKHLPASLGLDGALLVDLRPQIRMGGAADAE